MTDTNHILTETIQLPYKFTRDERDAITAQMLVHMQNKDSYEETKAQMSKEYGLKISTEENHIALLSGKLRSGEEMRSVESRVEFDVVRRMKRLFTIPVDGEESVFIREEVMTPGDFQTDLFKKTKSEWEQANPQFVQSAPEPVAPAPRTEQSKSEKRQAEAAERREDEAGKTPLRLALQEVANNAPVPDIKFDLNCHYGTQAQFVKDIKAAQKTAGWSKAQISHMEAALRTCEEITQMKELIRPFVKHTPDQPDATGTPPAVETEGDPTAL